MRIGVMGCGYWGSKHVRVLSGLPEVDEVWAIDESAERRRALSRSFPAIRSAETLDEALPSIDGVIVAIPPAGHAKAALQALEAGRHVLVEKPMATSAADCELMIDEADRRGVVLMVGHTFQFNPAVRRLREIVQSGELGNVFYVDAARLNLGLYQSDVNVIWDLAPHDISIINYLLDETPSVVMASGARHAHASLEDVSYVQLFYERQNVTAHIHVSWLDPCKVRRVTVVGSRKMAVYNDLSSDDRIRLYDRGVDGSSCVHDLAQTGAALHKPPVSYRYGDVVSPYIAFSEPLEIEDQHFVECVRSGVTPLTDGNCGLAVVQVLEAAQHSLAIRRSVDVPTPGLVVLP